MREHNVYECSHTFWTGFGLLVQIHLLFIGVGGRTKAL